MRELVLTPKFKRAFRKFVKRNPDLQKRIEESLHQMQRDVFAANLGTHKLSGSLSELQACSCGYDCNCFFDSTSATGNEVIVLLNVGTHDEVY